MDGNKKQYRHQKRPATAGGRKKTGGNGRPRRHDTYLRDVDYNLGGGDMGNAGKIPNDLKEACNKIGPICVDDEEKRGNNNKGRKKRGGNRLPKRTQPLAYSLDEDDCAAWSSPSPQKQARGNRQHLAKTAGGTFSTRVDAKKVVTKKPSTNTLLAKLHKPVQASRRQSRKHDEHPASWNKVAPSTSTSAKARSKATSQNTDRDDAVIDVTVADRASQANHRQVTRPPPQNSGKTDKPSSKKGSALPGPRQGRGMNKTRIPEQPPNESVVPYMDAIRSMSNARQSRKRQPPAINVDDDDDHHDDDGGPSQRPSTVPARLQQSQTPKRSRDRPCNKSDGEDGDEIEDDNASDSGIWNTDSFPRKSSRKKSPPNAKPQLEITSTRKPPYARGTTDAILARVPRKSPRPDTGSMIPAERVGGSARFETRGGESTSEATRGSLTLRKANSYKAKRKKANPIVVGPRKLSKNEAMSAIYYAPVQPSTPKTTTEKPGRRTGSTGTARRRRSSRLGKDQNEVIELLSDNDSDTGLLSSQEDKSNTKPTPTRGRARRTLRLDIPRVAIGKKVLVSECKVVFQNEALELHAKNSKKASDSCIAHIDLVFDDVLKFKHYIAYEVTTEEEFSVPCFLAMKVKPTHGNKLTTYKNAYQVDSGEYLKSHVVAEFSSEEDLRQLLDLMETLPAWKAFVKDSGLAPDEAAKVCVSLTQASKKGKRGLGTTKVTDPFVASRPEDTVVLVYPFALDPLAMEKAAEGLLEASGNFSTETEPGVAVTELGGGDADDMPSEPPGSDGQVPTKGEQRRHFLTVQVRDFERLCPGEFLNDTLIDFWIQWMTRKADPLDNSVHCFSSHFFTTLVDEGAAGVQKWTAKKEINVFEKKFIFIPINEALHWSLCVVVNPGSILDDKTDAPQPCLLFLDSLKAHRKKAVSTRVRKWLNSEWKRINGSNLGVAEPFKAAADFPLLNPKIPYQDNSWDCGVFVCRYAYAVYCLRNRSFRRSDDWFRRDLVESCPQFQFNMSDIRRLRGDIRVLIEKLSRMYLPWKKLRDNDLKEERRQAKQERLRQQEEETAKAGISVDQPTTNAQPEQIGEDAAAVKKGKSGERIDSGSPTMDANNPLGQGHVDPGGPTKDAEESGADMEGRKEENQAHSKLHFAEDPSDDTGGSGKENENENQLNSAGSPVSASPKVGSFASPVPTSPRQDRAPAALSTPRSAGNPKGCLSAPGSATCDHI